MRTIGSPAELERRRLLAVQRVIEGYSTSEVADFLGVDPSSVRRWVSAFRRQGAAGLAARPVPGRPRKLTTTQERVRRELKGLNLACSCPLGGPCHAEVLLAMANDTTEKESTP